MSESAFPTDLLSSLASNPDLLKNAMQMASALASSGALDGLFGKSSDENREAPTAPPKPMGTNDFSTLLSGFGGGRASEPPKAEPKETVESSQKENREPPHPVKRPPPPCHNDRIQLLRAVRPFLPEDKREKIDFIVQLLGLLHTAEELGLRKLF